jgi:hypothetical protein
MKKNITMILSFLFISSILGLPAQAVPKKILPESIGRNIASEFRPESAVVRIKGLTAWIEINGGTIDGIRIDKMKLLALLQEVSAPDGSVDSASYLSQMIKSSKGEVVLTEKDVNDYFKKNDNPEGFSDLQFDFKREGFTASGKFRTKIIIDLELPISANGVLGLRDDGVYLENTVIKVEGMSQPEFLTNMILSKLNPLLEFKDIPFPVTFEKIIMTDNAAIMTGEPKEFKDGETWKWKLLQ